MPSWGQREEAQASKDDVGYAVKKDIAPCMVNLSWHCHALEDAECQTQDQFLDIASSAPILNDDFLAANEDHIL